MALEPVLHDRAALEALEQKGLARYAMSSSTAKRLRGSNQGRETSFRTEFQRDRDRIIHSRAFRRLKQKTQVFMPDEGDHYRTRLSHTLEVSQLGRTLARSLGLNEDLVEAIALAHDVGHAPFGHSGEEILHRVMSGEDNLEGELPDELRSQIAWEGFKHNHQSLRIVDILESKYNEPGLNLTDLVREGILRHTGIHAKAGVQKIRYSDLDYSRLHLDRPLFLEGQTVAVVDEIAQHTHDLEDGFRAQVVDLEEVVERVTLCRNIRETIRGEAAGFAGKQTRNRLIHDVIAFLMTDLRNQSIRNIQAWLTSVPKQEGFRREWLQEGLIRFSEEGIRLFEELAGFVIERVIHCQEVDRMDARAAVIIPRLFQAYINNPRLLQDYVLDKICQMEGIPRLRSLSSSELETHIKRLKCNIRYLRIICDYIAGMTDSFAIREFHMMVYPGGEH